jgi:hypothetical protein
MRNNFSAHRIYERVREAIENNDTEAVRTLLGKAPYEVRAEIMPYLAIEAKYRKPEMASLLSDENSRVEKEAPALADQRRRDRNIALAFGHSIRPGKPSESRL